MNIYLIRHADAEKSSFSSGDFERKLTIYGEDSIRLAAEKWKNIIRSFDYIVSSPYVRTIQTAEIIAEVFGFNEEIIKDDKLISGGNTKDLIDIANMLDGENIAFVGHQPDFSNHAANLISSGNANIEFEKAAIAKISFNNRVYAGKGILEFLIPAEVFG